MHCTQRKCISFLVITEYLFYKCFDTEFDVCLITGIDVTAVIAEIKWMSAPAANHDTADCACLYIRQKHHLNLFRQL